MTTRARNVLSTFVHVEPGNHSREIPVTDSFWQEMSEGNRPELEQGRLLSAFTFSGPWSSWERHPLGEELVMLLAGACTLYLERDGQEQSFRLEQPGDLVLVPINTWHTATSDHETTLVFLTPGEGTEHKPAGVVA